MPKSIKNLTTKELEQEMVTLSARARAVHKELLDRYAVDLEKKRRVVSAAQGK